MAVVMVVDVAVSTVDAFSVETPALLGTKLLSPAAGDVWEMVAAASLLGKFPGSTVAAIVCSGFGSVSALVICDWFCESSALPALCVAARGSGMHFMIKETALTLYNIYPLYFRPTAQNLLH
jgi:hypothetical protein